MEHTPAKEDETSSECQHSGRKLPDGGSPSQQAESCTSSDINIDHDDDENKTVENNTVYDINNNITPENNRAAAPVTSVQNVGSVIPNLVQQLANTLNYTPISPQIQRKIVRCFTQSAPCDRPRPRCRRILFGSDELEGVDSEENNSLQQIEGSHSATFSYQESTSAEQQRKEDEQYRNTLETVPTNPLVCLPPNFFEWDYAYYSSDDNPDSDEDISVGYDSAFDEDCNSEEEEEEYRDITLSVEFQIIPQSYASSVTKGRLVVHDLEDTASNISILPIDNFLISNERTDTEGEDSEAEYDQPRLLPGICAAPRRQRRRPLRRNETNTDVPLRRRLVFDDSDDDNNINDEMCTDKRMVEMNTERVYLLCPSSTPQSTTCHVRRRLFDNSNFLDNRGVNIYEYRNRSNGSEQENITISRYSDDNVSSSHPNINSSSSHPNNYNVSDSQQSHYVSSNQPNYDNISSSQFNHHDFSNHTSNNFFSNGHNHCFSSSHSSDNVSSSQPNDDNIFSNQPSDDNISSSQINLNNFSSCQATENSVPSNQHTQNSVSSSQPIQNSVSSCQPTQNSFLPSHPNQNSVSSSHPIQNSVSSSQPTQNNVSSSQPIQNTVSSSQPIQNTVSSSQPIQNSVSSSQPIPNSVSSSQPIQNSVSSSQPIQNSVSSSYPIPNSVSSSQPIQNSVSSSQPIQNSVSSSYPIQNSVSSSYPIQNSVSSSQPTQNNVSSSQPSDVSSNQS